jgi:hypothetical protein
VPGQHAPLRGLRGPTGLLGPEGNDLGGGDRHGLVEAMAARWRDGVVPLASGPARTWHWWLVRNLTVYAGACACSKAQARERVASAHGCVAPTAGRRRAARRRGWGGRCRREDARACTRTGVRAHERPDARTTGRNNTTEGDASARRGETRASSVWPASHSTCAAAFQDTVASTQGALGRPGP